MNRITTLLSMLPGMGIQRHALAAGVLQVHAPAPEQVHFQVGYWYGARLATATAKPGPEWLRPQLTIDTWLELTRIRTTVSHPTLGPIDHRLTARIELPCVVTGVVTQAAEHLTVTVAGADFELDFSPGLRPLRARLALPGPFEPLQGVLETMLAEVWPLMAEALNAGMPALVRRLPGMVRLPQLPLAA